MWTIHVARNQTYVEHVKKETSLENRGKIAVTENYFWFI